MEHVSHEHMRIPSDIELEEHFQRFIADNDYIPSNRHHYPYLALFLVKKGRIGDFEFLFKHHPDKCTQPYEVWEYRDDDVNEYTDLIMYCIVHDLYDIAQYIDNGIGIWLEYTVPIIKYKRLDFLKLLIKNYLDSDHEFEIIHENILRDARDWDEGEELIYQYSNHHDIHAHFLSDVPYTPHFYS